MAETPIPPNLLNSEMLSYLEGQIQFIDNLHSLEYDATYNIRYVKHEEGRIAVYFLVRLTRDSETEAEGAALRLFRNLQAVLPNPDGIYQFAPISSACDLEAALQPFAIQHTAAVTRREEILDLSTQEAFYHVFPFTWHLHSRKALLRVLNRSPVPALASIVLKPTLLFKQEQTHLSTLVAACERLRAAQNSTAMIGAAESPPSVEYLDIRLVAYQQMRQLYRPFLVQVDVASSGELSPLLVNAVGQDLTRYAGSIHYNLEKETTALQNNYTTGGFSVVYPTSQREQSASLANVTRLDLRLWSPTKAPVGLQRLRHLVDAREANAAFRFPLPQPGGIPEIPSGIRLPAFSQKTCSQAAPVRIGDETEFTRLGDALTPDGTEPVCLSGNDRMRHVCLLGMTGTGKTTLLHRMIVSDIEQGRGVCVIDPHGDLVDNVLRSIPEKRSKDVILWDVADWEFPIGLNLLEGETEIERELAVQEAINLFHKLFDPYHLGFIGPRFENWMRNACFTVMAQPEGGTIVDVAHLFLDKDFREHALTHVTDPTVRYFWDHFKRYSDGGNFSEMYDFVTSKFSSFCNLSVLRNLLGQPRSRLNFKEIVGKRRILLARIPKGFLGELNTRLLGTVLVAKIFIAVLSRVTQQEHKRIPCYLYIDEVQNILSDFLPNMVAEGRKFGLSLVLANQNLAQLKDSLRETILANAGSLLCFRMGPEDSERIGLYFEPSFSRRDLTRLPNFQACTRLLQDNVPSQPFLLRTSPYRETGQGETGESVREKIIQQSRRLGRRREIVSDMIEQRLRGDE